MQTLICGSLAFDTIMVFQDKFKNHILPDKIHALSVAFYVPTLRALRCILTSFCSKPAANQKRHRHTQTISLSKLLISSVFLYLSSGVFCVKCPNKAVFCVVVAGRYLVCRFNISTDPFSLSQQFWPDNL